MQQQQRLQLPISNIGKFKHSLVKTSTHKIVLVKYGEFKSSYAREQQVIVQTGGLKRCLGTGMKRWGRKGGGEWEGIKG